jgi:hypothetical protein
MVGTTAGFQNLIMEALGPVIIFLNPMVVLAVSCEYLCCHPSSGQLWPPDRWKARGQLSGSCTLGTTGHQLHPDNLDMTGSSSSKMTRETYTPYQG